MEDRGDLMATTYSVTAPLVIARRDDGVHVHVYEGGILPETVDKDQLKQLIDSKMVAEMEAVVEETPVAEEPDGGTGDEPPAGNASLEEWHAYALAHGKTEAELEGKKRDEIRELFG